MNVSDKLRNLFLEMSSWMFRELAVSVVFSNKSLILLSYMFLSSTTVAYPLSTGRMPIDLSICKLTVFQVYGNLLLGNKLIRWVFN